MCGIVGLVQLDDDESPFKSFEKALNALEHRGPDHLAKTIEEPVALGHSRLSIIDLDARSNQPMTDMSGRYTIIFNGEIYNYRELKQELKLAGFNFHTESDTEVLLVAFIHFGVKCLNKLNGCFAFAIMDRSDKSIFLARDRMGIKPLLFRSTPTSFSFASELRSLIALGFEKKIDKVSLFTYFKLNYIPAPDTILEGYSKLEPGHYIQLSWKSGTIEFQKEMWYEIPHDEEDVKQLTAHDYKESKKVLKRFLRDSVRRRLVADVPVGTFLSGGVDSSIITALASQEKDDIESFSVGFPDYPYYDESGQAADFAKHLKIKHHRFEVGRDELVGQVEKVLTHADEPFADSSAINLYLLSEYTRKHVKVGLSGDGGDELFGGYNKHRAEYLLRNPKYREHAIGNLKWLWSRLPASRSGMIGNRIRQLQKLSEGYHMNARDRYWRWAGILNEEQANYLLKEEMLERDQRLSDDGFKYKKREESMLKPLNKEGSFNHVLLSDSLLVLPNDMLYKVDSMSMAHGLEVRTPLLDQHVVKQAFRYPEMFKINHFQGKKVLKEAFEEMLTPAILNRPKKGFEVPLLEWLQGPLKSTFLSLCDESEFIIDQGLFNHLAINDLKNSIYSNNPGDKPATAWAFMMFQTWYKRYMN